MATNEGSRLIYSTVQLDLKRKAIRLVAVLPSDQSALISCKFHIQMLQESISYTALSYTWGDASNPMGIVLDGKPFKVRKNLWQFLQKMRQQGSLELFWIDAICIDQENVQERNHQVSLMKDIYSKASQVAFWLGPASANSNLAIEMIKMGPSFHKKGLLPMWTPDEGKALLELCSRSYWKRIRIIQEFLFAQDIKVHCGEDSFSWAPLGDLIWQLWTSDGSETLEKPPYIQEICESFAKQTILERKKLGGGDFRPQLYELMKTYKHMECTDVRDKVYGLLGLAATGGCLELRISADYSKSASEIYWDSVDQYPEEHLPLCFNCSRFVKAVYETLALPINGAPGYDREDFTNMTKEERESWYAKYEYATRLIEEISR